MNVPSKTDHYLMQLTEQLRWVKSDGSVPFDSNRQRIQFVNARSFATTSSAPVKDQSEMTEEEVRRKHREQAKAMLGHFGGVNAVQGGDRLLQKIAEQEARDGR